MYYALPRRLLIRSLSIVVATAVCSLFVACDQSSSASSGSASHDADALQGNLTLTGSSTIAPLAAEIAARFERLHPGVRVDVQTGGSSRGIRDAMRGAADIGMVSRDLKPDESVLQTHTVARDGVGIIIHSSNPVAALSDDQVTGIYTGGIRNWNVVGGSDAPIVVANKASGRATLEVFLRHFQLDERQVRADIVIGDNQEGIKTVAGNPHAIGYVSIGAAEFEADQGVPIRLLPASGVPATTEALTEGRFPISRPLNLVTADEPTGLANAFIDYAKSDHVHDLIRGLYFVPIKH